MVVSMDTTATMPVYAMNFNNISSCNLKLTYDPSIVEITSVTIGPGMGGIISTNLATPGIVILGWFTSGGIDLPDSSVIFSLHATKISNGLSSFQWIDDGYSCLYSDGSFTILNDSPTEDFYFNGSLVFQSPDAPVTTIPSISALAGTNLSIPVTVSNFQMIGSLSLSLQYNPLVLSYLSYDNNADFPGLEVDASEPGIILISGMVPVGDTAVTLEDNAELFALNFSYLGGYSELNWIDDGLSCHYSGSLPVYPLLNDTPQESFYSNGAVSENALPAGAGPVTGPVSVCAGETAVSYSIPEIEFATGYVWSVPDGSVIISGQNTNYIMVEFGSVPVSGDISVYGTNQFGSGNASSLYVTSNLPPQSAGPISGQQEVCRGQNPVSYSVQTISGTDSYNWSLPYGTTIVSGMNTNSIEVVFGPASISGLIMVSGSNICGNGPISEPLPVTLFSPPQLLEQPASPPVVYAGQGNAIFNLSAAGDGLTYHWQELNDEWTDLNENSLYTGVFTNSLRIVNPPVSLNGKHYRCIVNGVCLPEAISDGNAMLTVLLPVGINENYPVLNLQVFPNPFNQYFDLKLFFNRQADITIKITDISGRLISSTSATSDNIAHQTIRVNTIDLIPGFYLIKAIVKTENSIMIHTGKLVCYH
ncbi:MAG: cohesin domain-containing protein [Lentimicrobium sp.]|uniref:cohesin domain-containing protein n=1 Tax=Lentimicrobium sp. TaxID=2034841 RepID=UPI0025D6C178|nr:cohesin domain-containing protein [Lentimicrobium sp.]MCO5256895.1 cohesin domain-containing protein [Lentimicrobium sp.]